MDVYMNNAETSADYIPETKLHCMKIKKESSYAQNSLRKKKDQSHEENSDSVQPQLEPHRLMIYGNVSNVNVADTIVENKIYQARVFMNKKKKRESMSKLKHRKKLQKNTRNTKIALNVENSLPNRTNQLLSTYVLRKITYYAGLILLGSLILLELYFGLRNISFTDEQSKPKENKETRQQPVMKEEILIFHDACRGGDLSRIIDILYEPPPIFNVNDTNYSGDTCLHLACTGGHINIVKQLLRHGAFVNASNKLGRTPLHEASSGGYSEVVKILCKYGANVNAIDNTGTTPLAEASERGNEEVVKILTDHKADVNLVKRDLKKATGFRLNEPKLPEIKLPLLAAAKQGYKEIVKHLLQEGAAVNVYNGEGWSAVHSAAYNGNLSIVKLLMKYGANVDVETASQATPLLLASQQGHADVVLYLLTRGANIDHTQKDGATALILATQARHEHVVNILVQHKAVPTATINGKLTSALHFAVNKGHTASENILLDDSLLVDRQLCENLLLLASHSGQMEVVKWLLKKGITVDCKEKRTGVTPLMAAAIGGQADVMRVLLRHGAKPTATIPNRSINPLIAAIHLGHKDLVDEILSRVSVEYINAAYGPEQFTPLQHALVTDNLLIFTTLLEHGASPVIQNNASTSFEKSSVFCIALVRKNVLIAKKLLDYGVDVNLNCQKNVSTLKLAVHMGPPEMVSMLLDFGAKPLVDSVGLSLLGQAAFTGKVKMVELLINRGFDVNSADKIQNFTTTPLQLAAIKGHVEVAKVLLKHGANIVQISELWASLCLAAVMVLQLLAMCCIIKPGLI